MSIRKPDTLPRPITQDTPPIRLAVYGDGGVGKTSLLLSFPKCLVIDTDGGLEGGAVEGITGEQWDPDRWKDLNDLYFWLKSEVKARGYQTIGVDSIDTLCRFLLHESVDLPTQSRVQSASSEELMTPELRDYGKVAYATNLFLTKLKNLSKSTGVNVVLTSAVRLPNIEKGRVKRTFDLQEAVEASVCYWANIYGELTVEDVKGQDAEKRVLWTRVGDPKRKNKTRFAALRPGVIDPTYTKIKGLIDHHTPAAKATNPKGSK